MDMVVNVEGGRVEAEARQRRGRGEVEEVRMMGPGIEDSWTEASEEKKKQKKKRER